MRFHTGIAAFTNFCYSQHVSLLYNNASVQSESGAQQGDLLGPLLFSLTLWPVVEKKDTRFQILPSALGICTMFSLQAPKIKSNNARCLSQGRSKKGAIFEEKQVQTPVSRRFTLSWSRSYKEYGQWFWSTWCRRRITRICFFLLAETCSKDCVALGDFELSWWSSICSRHNSLLLRDAKVSLVFTH